MNILIFGATGSIGIQSINVVRKLGHKIVGCSFHSNISQMQKIIKSLKYDIDVFSSKVTALNTVKTIDQLFEKTKPDLVINAISGFAGLEITLKTILNKIDLALANKESYVLAGWKIKEIAKAQGVNIFPIDSEHCAIYDLMKNKRINKLLLTASGGPFYNKEIHELNNVSFYEAKNHPNWKMGYKISIDSATLMNKCFEMIEAYYMFNIKNIEAIYHPQSIVHSMIEFSDNSVHAQMSIADMKLAIELAISKFKSKVPIIEKLSFEKLNLSFDYIDENKWLPIKWAKYIIKNDDRVLPVIINAANDAAIELFKNKKIKFNQIIPIISLAINDFSNQKINNIKDIFILNSIIKQYILSKF
ncbi:1-deoxy-D-xylulose 5-phosphate reductoisomerase [Malacoplasma muris]|uniref:1-deoxy-D-xylulose 5-phosphate reductoisomerase n=1 Tax=Malacoplasma muris TaxID=2119 RepID=UPI00398E73FF